MTRNPRSALDTRLTDALGPIAADAPLPANTLAIPRRWVRGSTPLKPRRIAGAGLVVATAAALTMIGIGWLERAGDVRIGGPGEDVALPFERLFTDPLVMRTPAIAGVDVDDAVGPVVGVARGRVDGSAFRLVAYRGTKGNCIWFEWMSSSSQGCGQMPNHRPLLERTFEMTTTATPDWRPGYVMGLVSPVAARVWVEDVKGERASAHVFDLTPADIEVDAYVVFLPAELDMRWLVAVDQQGAVVGRLDISSPAHEPEGDGPLPTPEPRPPSTDQAPMMSPP